MSPNAKRTEVRVACASIEALQDLFERELRFRRVFVSGQFNFAIREPCVLVVEHPSGGSLMIPAEAVYAKPDEPAAGVGLDLTGLDAAKLAELEAFVQGAADESSHPARSARAASSAETEAAVGANRVSHNIYERIRNLSLRERDSVARAGTLSDRVALERTFGGSVWEGLLQNPQLTAPEVAHIAKNGTLSTPLVGVIVANAAWLSSGEVRRALLGNPRVAGPHLDRVLRALSKVELKQVAQMSAYRGQVRAAAKRLLGD